jgi:hypothetical protein
MGVVLEYVICIFSCFPFGCDRIWLVMKMVGRGHFVFVTWFVFQVEVGFGVRVWCVF